MEVHAMRSITQDNHHTKCFFGKINAVFSAVSYRQNLARRQCQQNQRNSSYADFPASCQHCIPAQVSLHVDESTSGHVAQFGKEIPVRFVYVHNRNRHKDYLVLVTTDMTFGEEEVISLYGKRWGIEVFFKICKSYLHLSKDCRSISYDAMTAHVAVGFPRYMLLAVEQWESQDLRSIGELFYLTIDELPDLQFLDALHLVLLQFAELVQKNCLLSE
jgi:hypothetical protein